MHDSHMCNHLLQIQQNICYCSFTQDPLNHVAELTNLLDLKYRINSFQSSPPALPAYMISPMPKANTTCDMEIGERNVVNNYQIVFEM
jgi:hypothetical protein